ncbi:MAG: hypothetical protein WC718_04270 [Phycisphaerales bacterium]|jgi:hypothetical protein
MKRVPRTLRKGQLVVLHWLDASWAREVEGGAHVTPTRAKTVGWIRKRTDRSISVQGETFPDDPDMETGRDVTTVTAEMLRRVRVLADVGET